ncbi:GSCFA domain-containing protein [Tateyamaria sp.]|uniref:GSCFA domain-containing protein n=1 Tax=Tateyamaria sp. TaxID=1929288 RepID=UPI003B21D53C
MSSDISPYQSRPPWAFWRSAVVERQAEAVAHLHQPKFQMDAGLPIMTAGSCFAQHLHRKLDGMGWNVIQTEDIADRIPRRVARRYGYGLYSARYGNLYTPRQLVELMREVGAPAPIIWEKDGRFYDALRPGVEPQGLGSAGDVVQARAAHLKCVEIALSQAQCLIFTLGLTEAWVDRATGRTLPTAPGTIAGTITDNPVDFVNFGFAEILGDMITARDMLMARNPDIKMLLTVSPVPLTATATEAHVAVASTTSKSILRAVCAELVARFDNVDYFPSYEIITTPVLGGPFFADNLRDPSEVGVAKVMDTFVASYADGAVDVIPAPVPVHEAEWDVQCEEIMLEAFRT